MNYVIIGNGVAANSAAEAIRQVDKTGSITMLSRSRHYFYYVPALPEYLAGEKSLKDFTLHDADWYDRNGIDLHLGAEVTAIDPEKRAVFTREGMRFPYDRLLLATGGTARVPPIKGVDHEGVMTLRTIDDADRILEKAAPARRIIVVGGGLLGLEAGNGLRKRGLEVSVLEVAGRLLPRQTDPDASVLLRKRLEGMGFVIQLGVTVDEISRIAGRLQVQIRGGEKLETDMVLLVSAGVRPETALAEAIGLPVGAGVQVDDHMSTAREDIYAAGDLVEHRGRYYGIWPAAMAQGRVAGSNMAGRDMLYEGTLPANRLKVAGVDLAAIGEIDPEGSLESLVSRDEEQHVYRKLVLRDDTIVGAMLLGDIHGSDYIQFAIKNRRDISDVKDEMGSGAFDFSTLK